MASQPPPIKIIPSQASYIKLRNIYFESPRFMTDSVLAMLCLVAINCFFLRCIYIWLNFVSLLDFFLSLFFAPLRFTFCNSLSRDESRCYIEILENHNFCKIYLLSSTVIFCSWFEILYKSCTNT